MDPSQFRRQALELPEATEEPHFEAASFRVRGRIFATLPRGDTHGHIFIPDELRADAVDDHPAFVELLYWGGKVRGVRVNLAAAQPAVVAGLLRQAWRSKAPRALIKSLQAD